MPRKPKAEMTTLADAQARAATPAPGASDAVIAQGIDPTEIEIREREERSEEIIRRRIESGDSRASQTQVPLRAQGFTTRWVNSKISGRLHEVSEYRGWLPVRWDELATTADTGEYKRSPSGNVVRGENGSDVLYKIRTTDYKDVANAKASRIHKQLGKGNIKAQARGMSASANDPDNTYGSVGVDEFKAGKSIVDIDDE